MLRQTLLIASFALGTLASADTLVLSNGDRITGSVISDHDGVITFQSDFIGMVTISSEKAHIEKSPTVTPEEAAAAADQIVAAEDIDEPAPLNEEEQKEADAVTQSINDAHDWVDSFVPEGWTGKMTFGFSYLESSSETIAMNFGFNGKKDSAPHHYRFDTYYQYNKQTDSNSVEDKNQDTYGAGVGYDYDLNDWIFINTDATYLRNMVKDIRHQADIDLGIGFRVINEDHISLNIIPAYTLQYKDAEGVSQKWYNLATIKENFHYDLNEIVRFEQTASASVAPADTSNYQYEFTAALISKLADWIDASISYELTYDNTVGTSGTKKEQQIIFGLGVPY